MVVLSSSTVAQYILITLESQKERNFPKARAKRERYKFICVCMLKFYWNVILGSATIFPLTTVVGPGTDIYMYSILGMLKKIKKE